MISTFFYALLTDRAYLAHWADGNPIPLETLFEKPNINWSFEPYEMRELFDRPEDGLTFQEVDTLNQKYEVLGRTMFPDGSQTDFRKLWNGTVSIRALSRGNYRPLTARIVRPSSLEPSVHYPHF